MLDQKLMPRSVVIQSEVSWVDWGKWFLTAGNEAFLNTVGGATLWGIWVLEAEARRGSDDLVSDPKRQMLAAMLATGMGGFSIYTYLQRRQMSAEAIDASFLQTTAFINLEVLGGAGSMLGLWTAFRVGIDVFFGVEAPSGVFYAIDAATVISGAICAHQLYVDKRYCLRSEPDNKVPVPETHQAVYDKLSKPFSNVMLHCVGGWSATWGLMSVVAGYFNFAGIELVTGDTVQGKAYVGGALAWSFLDGVNATYQYLSKETVGDSASEQAAADIVASWQVLVKGGNDQPLKITGVKNGFWSQCEDESTPQVVDGDQKPPLCVIL